MSYILGYNLLKQIHSEEVSISVVNAQAHS